MIRIEREKEDTFAVGIMQGENSSDLNATPAPNLRGNAKTVPVAGQRVEISLPLLTRLLMLNSLVRRSI